MDKRVNRSASSSDDDSDSSEDEQDNAAGHSENRPKRSLEWCGTRNNQYYHPPRVVVWPPPSTSAPIRKPPPFPPHNNFNIATNGGTMFGNRMQLYSQTGQLLAVYPDGKVRGTVDENDLHTYMELSSTEYVGHVRIKGMLTNLYIAMNKKGRLYGESDPTEESTVFIESLQGSYNTYLSRKYCHLGWYIGLKKSGKQKRGPKTRYGQKAIKFLPIRKRFQ